MADYLMVRRTTSSSDTGFYQDGTTAFTRESIGAWKVAYKSDTTESVRLGVYRTGSIYSFVFVTSSAVSSIDIRMVSPTGVVVGTVQQITAAIGGNYVGYFNTFSFTPDDPRFTYTVFTSQQACLEALAPSQLPDGSSGVVVTAIASAEEVLPTTTGVIVTAIAKLVDPNQQGGTSETGGGRGTFDETSDVIPLPSLPSISAANSGLVTIFRPSLSELTALGKYLWTNITDFIENLQKMFSNPMDYFVAFHIVPCNPSVGSARIIKLGLWETSISMPPVTSQWYELNCGTVSLSEFWGSALDYAPNTKVSLFLPFIGSVTLNTDEVMGRQVSVVYRIDLLSGQCVAMVTVNVRDGQAPSVLYQFTGECGVSIPLTGADWSRVYSAAIGAVGTAITGGIAAANAGAAAGGATAALVTSRASEAMSMAGQSFAFINETSKGVKGVQEMRDQMVEASKLAAESARQAASAPTKVGSAIRASRIANTINNTVGQVISGKHGVQHSGTISGSAGMLGVKTPYLLIEYPNQSLATNYNKFVGYPSNMYASLGSLSGYTECEQVIPIGIPGTDGELAEILESLKGGVYL